MVSVLLGGGEYTSRYENGREEIEYEYFQVVVDGRKTFELRLNDFDIEEGDTLLLKEWDPETKTYTGREVAKMVGYVGKWKLPSSPSSTRKKKLTTRGFRLFRSHNLSEHIILYYV